MEKVWVFYGKTEGLTGRAEAKGEKGRLETRAGRVLLAHALKKLYGLSVPDGEEGQPSLKRCLQKEKTESHISTDILRSILISAIPAHMRSALWQGFR